MNKQTNKQQSSPGVVDSPPPTNSMGHEQNCREGTVSQSQLNPSNLHFAVDKTEIRRIVLNALMGSGRQRDHQCH